MSTWRVGLVCSLAIALSGCATNLYQWGSYENQLYQQYKDPSQAESVRLALEEHIRQVELSKQKVAPGLYAELGTFYLEAGDPQSAIRYYEFERDAWPESQVLMNAMIQNLQRLSKNQPQDKARQEKTQ